MERASSKRQNKTGRGRNRTRLQKKLPISKLHDKIIAWETRELKAAYPLCLFGGVTLQTKERRAMPMYVTYPDLIQVGIFIVALVSLLYQIFRGKR